MMWHIPTRLDFVGVSLFFALSASSTPVRFAAPEIMLFHGRGLARPVAVATWQENHTILLEGERRVNVDPAGNRSALPLDQRPYLDIALFWGNWWRPIAQNRTALDTLRASRANQTGRYYPRHRGAAAQIVLNGVPRPLSDSALAVLRRHGIPIEM